RQLAVPPRGEEHAQFERPRGYGPGRPPEPAGPDRSPGARHVWPRLPRFPERPGVSLLRQGLDRGVLMAKDARIVEIEADGLGRAILRIDGEEFPYFVSSECPTVESEDGLFFVSVRIPVNQVVYKVQAS